MSLPCTTTPVSVAPGIPQWQTMAFWLPVSKRLFARIALASPRFGAPRPPALTNTPWTPIRSNRLSRTVRPEVPVDATGLPTSANEHADTVAASTFSSRIPSYAASSRQAWIVRFAADSA